VAALYRNCPKCDAETGGQAVCPACGLIFEKYPKARVAAPRPAPPEAEEKPESRLRGLLFHFPEEVEPLAVYARAALLAAAAIYGARLALMSVPDWEMSGSLMHLVIVPFHEFGHILFRPFGEFLTLLGGSLFQVALPLVLGSVFLVRTRDTFAASLMLWWAAAAVMDAAPYLYDAWEPQHVLLTGRTGDTGAHDFIDTLGDLGLLHLAQPIGRGVHAFGVLLMLVSLAWGAWLVWQQFRNRR